MPASDIATWVDNPPLVMYYAPDIKDGIPPWEARLEHEAWWTEEADLISAKETSCKSQKILFFTIPWHALIREQGNFDYPVGFVSPFDELLRRKR